MGCEHFFKVQVFPSIFPFLFSCQAEVGRCWSTLWCDGNRRYYGIGKCRSTTWDHTCASVSMMWMSSRPRPAPSCPHLVLAHIFLSLTQAAVAVHRGERGCSQVGWWGREEVTETASISCCRTRKNTESPHITGSIKSLRVQDQHAEHCYFTKLLK